MSETKRDQKTLLRFSGTGAVTARQKRKDGFSKRAGSVSYIVVHNCPCSHEELSARHSVVTSSFYYFKYLDSTA